MSNGKYQSRKSNKALLVLLALVLVIGCTVGGTLAWLTAETGTATNTFTVGDIGTLTLKEKETAVGADGVTNNYTIVPGMDIAKDPMVSYKYEGENEAVPVYVFVNVVAEGWTQEGNAYSVLGDDNSALLSWSVDCNETTGWKPVSAEYDDVYYKVVAAGESLENVAVIAGNKITVSSAITEKNVSDIAKAAGDITFTAYAIQQAGFGTVADAWEAVSGN